MSNIKGCIAISMPFQYTQCQLVCQVCSVHRNRIPECWKNSRRVQLFSIRESITNSRWLYHKLVRHLSYFLKRLPSLSLFFSSLVCIHLDHLKTHIYLISLSSHILVFFGHLIFSLDFYGEKVNVICRNSWRVVIVRQLISTLLAMIQSFHARCI